MAGVPGEGVTEGVPVKGSRRFDHDSGRQILLLGAVAPRQITRGRLQAVLGDARAANINSVRCIRRGQGPARVEPDQIKGSGQKPSQVHGVSGDADRSAGPADLLPDNAGFLSEGRRAPVHP
jgi:hypothetical protein